MKAMVDQNRCIGCGLCASMCEEVFIMNEEGVSEAVSETIIPELLEAATEACNCCPVDAISIEE